MTRIELLGRIAVTRHGEPGRSAGLPGRRAELAFAYLVAEHHRVVSQDELADALWPERLPDSWAAAVRSVVAEVRRFLNESGLDAPVMLERARRGYQVHLPQDVVVDLDEARHELAQARARLGAGAAAEAAGHAARAATLARLPFLPSHEGEWVDGIRRELDSIAGRALELEVRAHRDAGAPDLALAAAERLVRADPFNEAAHRLRIGLFGQLGDRAGAARAYDECRSVLADELGADPSAETEAVLEEAVRDHPVEERRPPGPAAPAVPPPGERSPFADHSVLVVEDHDFQRRMAVRILRGLGVGTLADAANGVAALDLLADLPAPDVILCDIDMPEMDGVQFIRHVAQRGLAGAVIIASGLDSKVLGAVTAIGEAHGLQVLGAVEKPLNARRLGELLESYHRQPAAPVTGPAPVDAVELKEALADGRLTTRFEPRVDLSGCEVSAVVAVAGWPHPSLGWIHQSAFVGLLEREAAVTALTEATLAGACAEVWTLEHGGLQPRIGVEVSEASLADPDLADRFLEIVAAHGAEPDRFTCEVSEHSLAKASIRLDVLTRLRVKGFGLALGRFGSRHLPIDRLASYPFTEVKVDGSLVSGASGDRRRVAQLETALEAARTFGVPVVATGCDGEADFDLLVDLECRFAEGTFIGPAMAAADLVAWAPHWSPATGPGQGSP